MLFLVSSQVVLLQQTTYQVLRLGVLEFGVVDLVYLMHCGMVDGTLDFSPLDAGSVPPMHL